MHIVGQDKKYTREQLKYKVTKVNHYENTSLKFLYKTTKFLSEQIV